MWKRLRDHAAQLGTGLMMQQGLKALMILAVLPGLLLFNAVGAPEMVALLAGLGVAMLVFSIVLERQLPDDKKMYRVPLLFGAALLAYAAGAQTVIYRLGLDAEAADAFGKRAFGVLIGGGMVIVLPLAAVMIPYEIVRRLRGTMLVEDRIILVDAGLAGLGVGGIAVIPTNLLQWWTGWSWLGTVSTAIFVVVGLLAAIAAYRRLNELLMLQEQRNEPQVPDLL